MKRILFILVLLFISAFSFPLPSFASTGCNYPASLDSWIDKTTPASLSIAEVNQFRCAIEKLEAGPIRPNKGTAAAPAYSFQGDGDTGMDSLSANQLDFMVAGFNVWRLDNSGNLWPPLDNTRDIGAAANRIRDIYMAGAFKFGLDAALGTITANDPVLNATVTWNNGAIAFEGIKLNATCTACAGASSFLDLQLAGASLFKVSKSGAVASDFLLKPPNERRWAYLAPTGSTLTTVGDDEATTAGTPSHVAGVPPSRQYATAASIGADAGFIGNGNYRRQTNTRLQFRGVLSSTASIRAWIGLADETLTTMTATDTPARDFAAFRYSTVAGDANFKACTGSGGVVTCTDTGVAASTNEIEFEIFLNESVPNAVFKIDGATVATNTTNLPVAAQSMSAFAGIETQAAAAKNIKMQWMYADADK